MAFKSFSPNFLSFSNCTKSTCVLFELTPHHLCSTISTFNLLFRIVLLLRFLRLHLSDFDWPNFFSTSWFTTLDKFSLGASRLYQIFYLTSRFAAPESRQIPKVSKLLFSDFCIYSYTAKDLFKDFLLHLLHSSERSIVSSAFFLK